MFTFIEVTPNNPIHPTPKYGAVEGGVRAQCMWIVNDEYH
jgi:hypothetical protein